MLALPSGLIGDLKGHLGSTVFKASRSGLCIQRKASQKISPNYLDNFAPFTVSVLSSTWRFLAQPIRDSWSSAAASESTLDSFGNPISISGWNLFCKRNIFLLTHGKSVTLNPFCPAILPSIVISSPTFNIGTAAAKVPVAAFSPALAFSLSFSGTLSPGINHSNSNVRTVWVEDGTAVPHSSNFTGPYAQLLGEAWLNALGYRIFSKFILFHIASGKILLQTQSFVTIEA